MKNGKLILKDLQKVNTLMYNEFNKNIYTRQCALNLELN